MPLPDGYEVLSEGVASDVVIRSKVLNDIKKKATQEQQAGLEDLVKRYCKGGPSEIPPKKWNADEGWFPSRRAKEIRLEAFKPWQLRAYGFCRNFNGKPTFFITGVDTSKKQDEGNQSVIAAAGAEALKVERSLRQS